MLLRPVESMPPKLGHFSLKNVVSQYIQEFSDSTDSNDLSIGFDELKEALIREYNTELFKEDMQNASMSERLKKLSTTLNKLFCRNPDIFVKCMKTYNCSDAGAQ